MWQTPKGSRAGRTDEEAVALFDLDRDPMETKDVSHQHPDAVVEHLARMQRLVEGGSSPEAALPADQVPDNLPPPDLRERLRALGYID